MEYIVCLYISGLEDVQQKLSAFIRNETKVIFKGIKTGYNFMFL